MTITELRQRRAALIAEQRTFLDAHPDFTSEDHEVVQRMDTDIDRLEGQIAAEERNVSLTAGLERSAGTAPTEQPGGERRGILPTETPEYRDAFWTMVRSRGTQVDERALGVGSAGSGGYLVPVQYENRLITDELELNPIRQFANVLRTASDKKIPVLASRPVFGLIAEGGKYGTASEPTYGQKELDAFKMGGIIKVAEELLADSMFDLESHIAGLYADAKAICESAYFTTGTGTSQPEGFAFAASVGKTAADDTTIAADELIDLQDSLKSPYQKKAGWWMRTSSFNAVRKLKDSVSGQYLLVPGLLQGSNDQLLGKPVVKTDDMAVIAANARSIAYGDLSKFTIGDRVGISIQPLRELYAEDGQVGFKCTFRTDSALEVAESVKVLVQSAAN